MHFRKYADYSFWNTQIQTGKEVLSTPEDMFVHTDKEVDLRNVDCSNMDLSAYDAR